MSVVSIDPRDKTPIYTQLERGLRAAMATSRLRPGDQLPTVRQLAVELKINANTVGRVYADLERSGAIETRRGVGSFVRATAEQARPPHEHDKRVRAFVVRVLAEAGRGGFSVDDVLDRLIRRGVAEGLLSPDADDREASTQLVGPLFFAHLTNSVPVDAGFVDRTVDRFLATYRPA